MTKLVPPARRCRIVGDCTRVSFRGRRHQNITAGHSYGEAADRSCLWRLRWSNIWGTGIKPQRVVCLLFSMSRLQSLCSLLLLLACHFTSSRRSVYASPPVQGMHAWVKIGGGGFGLRKQSANEIPLLINNRLVNTSRLTVTEKNWKVSCLMSSVG